MQLGNWCPTALAKIT